MEKSTNQDTSGTSFHMTVIVTSVNELISALGEPQYAANDGNDKVNFEWHCQTDEGDVFTIYDWKEYRSISNDEQIEWHIGGDNASITSTAAVELEFLLNVEEYPGE